MKSSRARPSQAGGANITAPLIVTTSSNFTPNAYPFKYKVHLIAAGSSGGNGSYGAGANTEQFRYAGGGGSGAFYVSASTQTLSSGSLTFSIGVAASSTTQSIGGSTTVTRNDNAAIEAAWNTAFSNANIDGGNGGSGGGGGGGFNRSLNTGNTNNSGNSYGYEGYSGGQGVSGGYGSGGTGTSNTAGAQSGNDSRIPSGGRGLASNPTGTVPPSYAGIVISGTTYLAGTNYGKGGDGTNGGGYNNSFDSWGVGGNGAAILEPIP